MVMQEVREVEKKTAAILRLLCDSPEPRGGRVISRKLAEEGIYLGERAVRYHLKLMDERGLTSSAGSRDGRMISEQGREELENALVTDKVGLVNTRIGQLSYLTTLNMETGRGNVPVDIALFPESSFTQAMEIMSPSFRYGLCVTDMIAVARQGEKIANVIVPRGKIAIATLCSVIINGLFLKAGIPIDSLFAGLLQTKAHKPTRFTNLVHYDGSTLDPSEMFVAGRMTDVTGTLSWGDGKIVASYHEIPVQSKRAAESIMDKIRMLGTCRLLLSESSGDALFEIPVRMNKIGLVLLSSFNPVAAAAEAGIEVTCKAMSGLVPINSMKKFDDVMKREHLN
jgi:repressor of nif and glnA expression